jgi:hypothetical protein
MQLRLPSRNRFAPAAFAGIVVLAVACAAAVASHVAIDVGANFYVAHDPYDDLAHGSRFLMVGGALILALAIALSLLSAAVEDAGQDGEVFKDLVAAAARQPVAIFIGSVIVTSLLALVAMESFDSYLNAGGIPALDDAFGGSVIAGSAITASIASAFGFAARRMLRWIALSQRSIVRAIAALLAVDLRRGGRASTRARLRDEGAGRSESPLARRGAKRAPPLFA